MVFNFIYPLKESTFGFVDFCYGLFYLFIYFFAFTSALIFKISFLLLTLGFFISSFSSYFRCKVRLFIWLFFLFLEVCLYWNKTRVPTFTITIQYTFGSFGHSNQSRKINKRNPNWKRRNKTHTVWITWSST